MAASAQVISPAEHTENVKLLLKGLGQFTPESAAKTQEQLKGAANVTCPTTIKDAIRTPGWYYNKVLQAVDIEPQTAKRLAALMRRFIELIEKKTTSEDDQKRVIHDVYEAPLVGVEEAEKRFMTDQREASVIILMATTSTWTSLAEHCK